MKSWTLVAAGWMAVQVAVPLVRLDPRNEVPFSSRFSWSMFAGRPIARCTHGLSWRDRDGRAVDGPALPAGPVGAVLSAQTEREFARVVPLLTAYASGDDEVVGALHDLLRRHKRVVDPRGELVLESRLRCRTWRGREFAPTLVLGAR
jgi:hypothetical protein